MRVRHLYEVVYGPSVSQGHLQTDPGNGSFSDFPVHPLGAWPVWLTEITTPALLFLEKPLRQFAFSLFGCLT